ncbi:unnamed protein product [Diamesa serratosioi]
MMQKTEKRRNSTSRLKNLWRSPKTSSDSGGGAESPTNCEAKHGLHNIQQPYFLPSNQPNKPACSLPLLQIWPSQDSPRGEGDGQSFIFSGPRNDTTFIEQSRRRTSLILEHSGDSGIDSIQASPSPMALSAQPPSLVTSSNNLKQSSIAINILPQSPTPSDKQRHQRKLLHPDHARLLSLRNQTSPDSTSLEDATEFNVTCNKNNLSTSSSTSNSLSSIAAIGTGHFKRLSDPWLHRNNNGHDRVSGGLYDQDGIADRRRSSAGRYSLLDALDLEYALMRAAARGSVGPYSLSESLHKLTFTQSLAFPALARSITGKRRRSAEISHQRPLDPNESGLNIFAKVVTACVLVMVSFLVFLVVYKYTRT